MDEIKLKILSILEERPYQKVILEVFEKEMPSIYLFRHFEYLEQKRLIRLSKIAFAGSSEPQLVSAMLTAKGEDFINSAIREIESKHGEVPDGKARLIRIIESAPYQIIKDVIIPIFSSCLDKLVS
jgi:hypothetical protein